MILLCSNALPRLEISSIEKFLNAGGIIRARIISMNGSGCCDSRERKREGCKRKKKRRKEKRWKGTSIRGAKAALLYLWHALLTSATFPLEESFSPPAGIRPSVGWTSRNASRICNVTARLSSRFFSLLLSSSVYSSWEGTSFHASSPWETWKHRARRNIFRREIVPRRFPPKISYTSFHKDDTMIPWNFRSTIYSLSYHESESFIVSFTIKQVEIRGEHCGNFSSRTNPQNRSFKGRSCTRDAWNKEKYRNFFTSNRV